MQEAVVCVGGQDAVGCTQFDGGVLQSVLVAADGCSFADLMQSAQAAEVVVREVLKGSKLLSSGGVDLKNHSIEGYLEGLLQLAHKKLCSEYPRGATTAVVAAINEGLDGKTQKKRILLRVASCGDAAVMLVGKRRDGSVYSRKLNGYSDALEKSLTGAMGHDYFALDPVQRNELREKKIEEIMRDAGFDRTQAEEALTKSGLYTHLGTSDHRKPPLFDTYKYELTSLFADGVTDLRVIACSDNVGDKIDRKEVGDVLSTTPNNSVAAENLLKIMDARDQDDGSFAMVSVGRR